MIVDRSSLLVGAGAAAAGDAVLSADKAGSAGAQAVDGSGLDTPTARTARSR